MPLRGAGQGLVPGAGIATGRSRRRARPGNRCLEPAPKRGKWPFRSLELGSHPRHLTPPRARTKAGFVRLPGAISRGASGPPGIPTTCSVGSGGYCNEGHRRTRATPEVAGPRPPRGRAPQHHSDPRQRAAARRKGATVAEGDRPRPRGDGDAAPPRPRPAARPRCRRTCSTTSCASCPTARRSCSKATATARCWRSAPAARASPCRPCRRAIFPISPPAT